jgi:hypothetical protein
MNIPKSAAVIGALAALVVAAFTATVGATIKTTNGISLEYPTYSISGAGLAHCEPWNDATADDVTLSGVPEGSSVTLQFVFTTGLQGAPLTFAAPIHLTNQGGTFSVAIPYPQDTTTWPLQGADGSRTIAVAVSVTVTSGTTTTKFGAKLWKVVCIPDIPEEGDFRGCTPGFWKNNHGAWGATGYSPAELFDTVFGVNSSLNPPGPAPEFLNPTLDDAVRIGGGGQNAMARHAVAALLNAAHPDVDYPLTATEIILAVQNAYLTGDFRTPHNLFEGYNEIGCPVPADESQ